MKIRIRKTNRLVPVSSAYIDLSNPVFNPIVNYLPMTTSKDLVTDISRVPKRKNWEWATVPTKKQVKLESGDVTTNTFDMNINTFNMLGTTKLGFWQNIKYHIIWWKK